MSDIPIFEFPKNEEDFQKIWNQFENDLGHNDMNMQRNRPYCGQLHTSEGIRGATEIKGITFRDLRDCFIRAIYLSASHLDKELHDEANKGEDAALCENDLYKLDLNKLDPMAISQNLNCEVERLMGIFPNVPNPRLSE